MELQFFMLFGRGVGKWGRISFVGVCFKGNFELIFLGDFIRYLLQKTQEKSNVICLSFLPYVFTKLYQFLATSMLCRCMEKILKFFQEFFILIHALKLSFFHVYFPSFSTIFHFSVNIQLKTKFGIGMVVLVVILTLCYPFIYPWLTLSLLHTQANTLQVN